MMRGMWSSATGMKAQQLNIDTIANNLANVNTPGFKRSQATFQDMLYDRLRTAGSTSSGGSSAPGMEIGMGTNLVSVNKIFSPGKPQQTGNQFDVMIAGRGFFKINNGSADGAYTRDGSFHLDQSGNIVTADGYPLTDNITVNTEASAISIGKDGTVSQVVDGQTTAAGQIPLYTFPNPAGLLAEGGNLLIKSTASGSETSQTAGESGVGTLQQGFLELSNVEIVQEMVNLIVAQRAYEVNTKSIQACDDMLQTANNIRR